MAINSESGKMKARCLAFVGFILISSCSLFENEQGCCTCEDVWVVVQQMPVLKVRLGELQSKLNYPEQALADSVEGRVVVQFVVNKEGVPLNPKVIQSLTTETDAEAVRVVSEYERFSPARQNGEPVCLQYSLPIVFRLQN